MEVDLTYSFVPRWNIGQLQFFPIVNIQFGSIGFENYYAHCARKKVKAGYSLKLVLLTILRCRGNYVNPLFAHEFAHNENL